jgi:DNA uptake protein ComE-like DNA-binding protein/TM2 domain-containing membrane protein YozV
LTRPSPAPKNRPLATGLALLSAFTPVAGLHKFYVGQPQWGLLYLALSWTAIPHVASALEGIWYWLQGEDRFQAHLQPPDGSPDRSPDGSPEARTDPRVAIVAQLHSQGWTIDVNRATPDQWLQLPGITPAQAQSLVQLQRSGLELHSLEDLAAALDCSVAQVQPLAPLLCFAYYGSAPLPEDLPPPPVNPNRATLQELLTIPHLTPAIAQDIIHYRIIQGSYRDLADFQQRLQLPAPLVGQIMAYLTFRPSPKP